MLSDVIVYILMSGPIINAVVSVVFLVRKIIERRNKRKAELYENVAHGTEMDEKKEKEEIKLPEDNCYGGIGTVAF